MIEFVPGVRKGTALHLLLAGASGSGKTRSALRVASGMVGGDMRKVAVLDTEGERATHHLDAFDVPFLHAPLGPPFTPRRFIEAMHAAKKAGAEVLLIDSYSDLWEGEGGMQDMAAASKISGAGAWALPKAEEKKFKREARLSRMSIIYCCRAEEKVAIRPDPRKPDKTIVVPVGWMPITEKRTLFEMTAFLTLSPDRPGCVDLSLPRKVPDFFHDVLVDGRLIDEEVGRAMLEWSRGAAKVAVKDSRERAALDVELPKRAPPEEEPRRQPRQERQERRPDPSEDDSRPPREGPPRAPPREPARAPRKDSKTEKVVTDLIAAIEGMDSRAEYDALIGQDLVRKQMAWLQDKRPDLAARVESAMRDCITRLDAQGRAA